MREGKVNKKQKQKNKKKRDDESEMLFFNSKGKDTLSPLPRRKIRQRYGKNKIEASSAINIVLKQIFHIVEGIMSPTRYEPTTESLIKWLKDNDTPAKHDEDVECLKDLVDSWTDDLSGGNKQLRKWLNVPRMLQDLSDSDGDIYRFNFDEQSFSKCEFENHEDECVAHKDDDNNTLCMSYDAYAELCRPTLMRDELYYYTTIHMTDDNKDIYFFHRTC
jgi:hypothetical protein